MFIIEKMEAFSIACVYVSRLIKMPHIIHALQSEVKGSSFSPHPATLIARCV